MKKLFGRPKGLTDVHQRYCPGCGHGIVHRLIGELLVELNAARSLPTSISIAT
jgi:2-oxoglutarate ferredoxin oxidoreductase subunit beta